MIAYKTHRCKRQLKRKTKEKNTEWFELLDMKENKRQRSLCERKQTQIIGVSFCRFFTFIHAYFFPPVSPQPKIYNDIIFITLKQQKKGIFTLMILLLYYQSLGKEALKFINVFNASLSDRLIFDA